MKTTSRFSFRWLLPCMAAILVLLTAGTAHAGSVYIVTLSQQGSDVVANGSGTIDLTGLTSFGSATLFPELYPAHGIITVGDGFNLDLYGGTSGPFTFGNGGAIFPSSKSGDSVELEDFGIFLDVPQGYVSGTSLSGSSTFDNTTLAKLGVTAGTYTWTWNSGANSFVLEIPMFAPEPSTFLMLGTGLLPVMGVLRRRHLNR